MKDKIVQLAGKAYQNHWRHTSSASTGSKQARKVTQVWQEDVKHINSTRFLAEEPIYDSANNKIDLIDKKAHTAYELKTSGKNPHHEFFKDIFKIISYNHKKTAKIKKFVFITECRGRNRLRRNGLVSEVVKYMHKHGITIELEALKTS